MTNAIGSALAGIKVNIDRFDEVALKVAQPGVSESYPNDVVELMTSQRGLEANTVVLKVADGMKGALIDLMG